jgi:hypothetical protein
VTKDAKLENLARLLNSVPPSALPAGDAVETREQYAALMAYLEPWVIAPPAAPLTVNQRPSPLVLDCMSVRCARGACKRSSSHGCFHAPRPGPLVSGVGRPHPPRHALHVP